MICVYNIANIIWHIHNHLITNLKNIIIAATGEGVSQHFINQRSKKYKFVGLQRTGKLFNHTYFI